MKNEIFPTLITPYASEMDASLPWNEYPRPSMVRESFFCLNGAWDFAVCEAGATPKYSEKILVPFPPESLLSGVQCEIPEGSVMHYKRIFSLPEGFAKEKIILQGNMPSPVFPPEGCPFHTRCFMAQEVCKRVPAPLQETEKGHFVACHFAHIPASEKRKLALGAKGLDR